MLSRHGGMEKYGIFVRQKNIKVSNSIMEEKKEMDEGLFKSRSYLSCLNEGLKLPTRHILSLLRFLYPSLIAGAVVMGLWGVFFNQITVALTRWMAASEPVVLSFPLFTLIILSVLSLLADSFYMGNVMTAVSRFATAGAWPALRFGEAKREIFNASLRALTCTLVAVVVFSLLIVPVTLWLGAGNVWVTVVSYVLLLALGVPYCMVIMDYMLGERRDFWCSLKRMKDGYQYWGAFFIILFCGGLIMGVLAAVSWLPAGILAYAGHASLMGVLEGDATDLPSYVPALVVFFFMLASVIANVFSWLTLFPLSYLYAGFAIVFGKNRTVMPRIKSFIDTGHDGVWKGSCLLGKGIRRAGEWIYRRF